MKIIIIISVDVESYYERVICLNYIMLLYYVNKRDVYKTQITRQDIHYYITLQVFPIYIEPEENIGEKNPQM